MIADPRQFLTGLFEAAVAAALPERTIGAHLPAPPRGRTIVIGAGKGSAQMAAAFEKLCRVLWRGWCHPLTLFGAMPPDEIVEARIGPDERARGISGLLGWCPG